MMKSNMYQKMEKKLKIQNYLKTTKYLQINGETNGDLLTRMVTKQLTTIMTK